MSKSSKDLHPAGKQRRWLVPAATLLLSLPVLVQAQPSDQYKRRSQDTFTQIVKGNLSVAEDLLVRYKADYPGDLEALFVETMLHAASGRIADALRVAQNAVAEGLPPGRFVAGPREMMTELRADPSWSRWIDSLDLPVLHGPMIGNLSPESVGVWLRTDRERRVIVEARSLFDATSAVRSTETTTKAADDYTAKLTLTGLAPGTQYVYRLEVDGAPYADSWFFDTPPREASPAVFRIAFGGGAGFTPWFEPIWDVIGSRDPIAFLFLGDNVYIDNPTLPEVQKYTYYRRQSLPRYRQFVASTGIYAIWDDHDFTTDDGWGGPEIDNPAWKREVWNIYKQNWINRSFGGGEEQPGVWYSFSLGDVDFCMLDGRYYREDPSNEAPRSMLGQVQKQWLKNALAASDAVFKVVASPVPWAEGTKPGSPDTWDGYAEEREELFRFLETSRIDGVVLLSADRHRSDLWQIPRPGGYDFYEFESSRLTNVHYHQVMEGAAFGYNQKPSFGLLTFDTAREDPQVTYEIVSIDNETVFTFTLPLSRLSFQHRRP